MQEINKEAERIVHTLINKQLEIGNHPITYDEILDQYEAAMWIGYKSEKPFRWYDLFTLTLQQNKDWFVWSTQYVKEKLNTTLQHAMAEVTLVDIQLGLKLKG
jgi:hypothetical protein